jgi:hypothetical protein
VALPSGEQHDQGFALALGSQMQLGTETTFAASQRLISPTFACSCGMLVRPYHRPIDEMERPVNVSTLICGLLQSREELVPESAVLPGIKSVGDGAPGTIALRQVTPGGSRSQNPEDPIENPPVGMIRTPPFLWSFDGEQGGQALPLRESRAYVFAQPLSVSYLPNTP